MYSDLTILVCKQSNVIPRYFKLSQISIYNRVVNSERCMRNITVSEVKYYRVRTVITKLNSRIFQYIPGWIELNFQDFSDSDVVHHTSVAINMLSSGRKLCE